MSNSWNGIIRADARSLPIADESVQCVVTSPPYWGLRDYGHDGQIGREDDVAEFINTLGDVFDEVYRVMKPDGTLWVNMGDAYVTSGGTHQGNGRMDNRTITKFRTARTYLPSDESLNLKEKDLIGMPWLLAFELRRRGWYLRQEIIWHKTQAMPESVTDRPTRNHEQLFLLAKSERYYYDSDAIKEKASPDTHARYARGRSSEHKNQDGGPGSQTIARTFTHMTGGGVPMDVPASRLPGVTPKSAERASGVKANSDFHKNCSKRIVDRVNKRTVWSLGTASYSGSHYAVFPPALVLPCILAGSRPGDIVLDPFAGSGTVAMVAEENHRRWLAVDLGYQDLQKKRLLEAQRGLILA
jgi:site-specific DNA-methyltransferase (cytosine-N4-specific)